MKAIVTLILSAFALFSEDNPWAKVLELKSHAELRIFKKGSTTPLLATFDEANNERILIVVRNAQMAVAREDIDRLDARPATRPAKWVKDTSVKPKSPDLPGNVAERPGESYGTSFSKSSGDRPDFETIYRRPAPRP